MRIATWNVNSIRSRIDRVEAWLERTDVDVLRDPGDQGTRRPVPLRPVRGPRLRGGPPRPQPVERRRASLSRVGLDDVQVGFDGMPGLGRPAGRRGAGDRGDLRRRAGVVALRAQRPRPRRPAHGLQAGVARALQRDGQQWLADDPDAAGGPRRRLEHRPAGRRRLGHGLLRGQAPTSPPASAPPSKAFLDAGFVDVVRPHTPGPGRLHLLGLHAAALPEAAGHADRLRARLPGPRRRASRARPSTARSARARAPPTTRRSSSSWRTEPWRRT